MSLGSPRGAICAGPLPVACIVDHHAIEVVSWIMDLPGSETRQKRGRERQDRRDNQLTSARRRSPAVQRVPFEDVDRIANSSGLVAIISQRSKDGQLTFAFFREFPSREPGKTDRTGFIPADMFPQFCELVQIVRERVAQLENPDHPDSKLLPFRRH